MNIQTLGMAVVVTCLAHSTLHAEVVGEFEIGLGESTSTTIVQFGNLNQYIFTINYDGTPTGRDVFDFMVDALPGYVTPDIESYEFGDFLYGLSIGDDHDEGFGTPPDYFDYWHYWTKDAMGDEWDSSLVGFSDRYLSDGSVDGWVFDSGDAPIPAPPAFLALFGAGSIRRRRG
jgi:hypothetical protein